MPHPHANRIPPRGPSVPRQGRWRNGPENRPLQRHRRDKKWVGVEFELSLWCASERMRRKSKDRKFGEPEPIGSCVKHLRIDPNIATSSI